MGQTKSIFFIYLLIALGPLTTIFFPSALESIELNADIKSFFTNFPYFCLLLASFLGINLKVRRVFYVSSLLFISYFVLLKVPDGLFLDYGVGKIRARQILALAFPIGLMVPYLFNHAKLISLNTLLMFVTSIAPFFIYFQIFRLWPETFNSIVDLGSNLFPFVKVPLLSIGAFIPLVWILSSKTQQKTTVFNMATVLSFIPFWTSIQIGFIAGDSKDLLVINTLFSYCVISFLILHSIYKLYWESVYFDPLTKIPNRRAMIDKFNDLGVSGYSIAVVDVDKFKNFNDTYGHDEGDNALKLVASILNRTSGQRAYRFGGEEFVLIFDHMNEQTLEEDLNAIREAVANHPFFIRTGDKKRKRYKLPFMRRIASMFHASKNEPKERAKKLQITISIGGVVKLPITKEDAKIPYEDFMKLADNALYLAKENGRNRVEIADHL